MLCFRVLTDYLHLLEDWKVRYAPKTLDDALDNRFVEALQMHCHIEYLADVLTVGDPEERAAVVDELMKDGKITFLQDYTARKKKEDVRYERRDDADLALECPACFDGKKINETVFCEEFLRDYPMVTPVRTDATAEPMSSMPRDSVPLPNSFTISAIPSSAYRIASTSSTESSAEIAFAGFSGAA